MNDKRTDEKEKWEAPELTVLVRNKPEEAVLVNCKTFSSGGAVTTTDSSCVQDCEGLSCDDYGGS